MIFRAVFDSKLKVSYREYRPEIGAIRQMVSTTATIKPQNRLEIKSPVSGRIDEILVREGEFVKKGQVLALISSAERAALLDAATLKGQSEIDDWNRVYNQTALISPIDGQMIVSDLNPARPSPRAMRCWCSLTGSLFRPTWMRDRHWQREGGSEG